MTGKIMQLRGFWVVALLTAVPASASETTLVDDEYCGRVQQFIANTNQPVVNQVFPENDFVVGFTKSKPSASPLTTYQYSGYEQMDGKRSDFSLTVSCKMKTTERVALAQQINSAQQELLATIEDRTCQQWTKKILEDLYAVVTRSAEEGADFAPFPRQDIVLDDDDNAYIGPLWVKPWPYQPAYTAAGKLHLRSKSLHAEYHRFMPVPDSFMGTHYCHLISPDYLSRLIRGEVKAPALEE